MRSLLPCAAFVLAGSLAAFAGDTMKAEVGKAAPAFTLSDVDGKKVSLSDFKGKIVVLEWFNPECPFVKAAHGTGTLKDYPAAATKNGVVWLGINSNAAGAQGSGADKNRAAAKDFGMAYPLLLDEDSKVAMAYGAKTTPHLFVIDAKGNLAYEGAIDNAPMGKVEGGGEKTNYVEKAIASLTKGEPVATTHTTSYGCTVKYPKAGGEKRP
jgi:peroxiredoxin